jgi:AraC family transcriptional regulator of adaptative response / DNA-3-methyladenine glycosylase II
MLMAALSLTHESPYDWTAMLGYLAARATPGVEAVSADRYWRSVQLDGCVGWFALSATPNGICVEPSDSLLPARVSLVARLRRLLDVDTDPHVIAAHFDQDALLAPLVARRPGLRVPGALDGFELVLRTVLGQQVTVRGATTLAGRLAELVGERFSGGPSALPAGALTRLAVTADRLADATVTSIAGIGLPRARAECVVALARAVAGGELNELVSIGPHRDPAELKGQLTALPGIGAWTAEYVVMRALRWPDAFPETDLVLLRAAGGLSPAKLHAAAEAWRPWRAYAAQHLWASTVDRARIDA